MKMPAFDDAGLVIFEEIQKFKAYLHFPMYFWVSKADLIQVCLTFVRSLIILINIYNT